MLRIELLVATEKITKLMHSVLLTVDFTRRAHE